MEGRVNEIGSDLSSPEEDKDKKKEDKPVVPLSNPIAMYYELNPPGASQKQEWVQAEEDCSQALLHIWWHQSRDEELWVGLLM